MNKQTKLSAEDAALVSALNFRQELLSRDQRILFLETQLIQERIKAAYGNPNEAVEVQADGTLVRTKTR